MKPVDRGSRLGAFMRWGVAALAVLLVGVSASHAQTGSITIASGASYVAGTLAPDAIGSIFGSNLAQGTTAAPSGALPTQLAGVSAQLIDSSGVARPLSLFFVSPSQVNFLVPYLTMAGTATVLLNAYNGKLYQGTVNILPTAPGLFSADASGKGLPAATYDLYNANGFLSDNPVATFDVPTQKWVAAPVIIGPASEQTYLTLYGTGIRYHSSSASSVTALVGGVNCTVAYAGAQSTFPGLDQVNVLLPVSLNGKGTVTVQLTVEGQTTNPLSIDIGTTPAAPTLSSLSPASGIVGASVSPFTIYGSNLTGGVVGISPAATCGAKVVFTSTSVAATSIAGKLVIAPDAPTGACTVSVLTGGGLSNSLTFTVNPPPVPSISSIFPWGVMAGQTTPITISGTNMSGVTAIQFTPPDGITVSNLVATSISVTANIAVAANAAYGSRPVAVVAAGVTSNQSPLTILVQDPTFVISNLVVGPGTNTPNLTLPIAVTFQDPSGAPSSGQPVTVDFNIGNGSIYGYAKFTPSNLTPGQTTGTISYTFTMPGYTWTTGSTIPITVYLEAPTGRASNTLIGAFVTQ
jgi:uncharacterized protein (TIGR03437 family)